MSEDKAKPGNARIVDISGDQDPELQALYREASTEQPPAELDAIIRQAARDAASASRPRYSWFTGVAASVLVGIILLQLYPDIVSENQPASIPAEPPASAREQVRAVERDMLDAEIRATERQRTAENSYRAEKKMLQSAAREAESRQPQQPTPAPVASASAPYAVSQADEAVAGRAAPLAVQSLSKPSVQADAGAGDSALMSGPGRIAAGPVAVAPRQERAAQALLREINELIEQGKMEQAEQRYRQLREDYPDFRVDEEVSALFDEPAGAPGISE